MDRLAMKMTADTVRDLGAELLLATDLPEERLTGYGWQFSSSRIPPLAVAYGRPMAAGTDPAPSFAAPLRRHRIRTGDGRRPRCQTSRNAYDAGTRPG